MCPALVSEIVPDDAPVSRAIGQFSPAFSAGNSQNSLGKFTSFLKWRIAKTMKVAISPFDNAKPTIVMLIQLLTHSLVYVWQRVNTHKYSKDCPENIK